MSALEPNHHSLQSYLRWHLGLQALPVVIDRVICPAASLWTGGIALKDALLKLGVQPGQRICMRLPNGTAFVQVMLACIRLGCGFCPLPAQLSHREVNDFAGRLQAAFTFDSETQVRNLLLMEDSAIDRQSIPATRFEDECLIFASSDESRIAKISATETLSRIVANLQGLTPLPEANLISQLAWCTEEGAINELLTALCAKAVIEVPQEDHLAQMAA